MPSWPFHRTKIKHCKILKISPGTYIFSKAFFEGLIFEGAYIRRGLSTEGNLRFKIDWASLIVGMKFTIFSMFCFVLEGNFQVQAPLGAYIRRGDLMEGFLRYKFRGLIFGGVYTWRGLLIFRNSTVTNWLMAKVNM